MPLDHPIAVGTMAPGFELQAATPDLHHGHIQSDDYRGRWLAILFYPRDFSFVCPTELTGFSAEKDQFDQRDCELLGISIDSVQSHLQWLKTAANQGGVEGLRFPLASDPQGDLCKRFGVWRHNDELPNRGLFLIDASGILRYAASYDLSVGRNVEDILRALDALQAGGLCPANWKRADGVLDAASMLQPGRVLGHYRIERELGQGAFGRVLEAEDLRLERKVALKIISKQDAQTEAKILGEARSAAGINHPNVCTVYSADVIDTLSTIVMEYVEGHTLEDVIDAGFDDQKFRRMAFQIAAGLAAAHAKGVVHGDVKPANILLQEGRDPIIVDFGLARTLRKSDSVSPAAAMQQNESEPTTSDLPLEPDVTLVLRGNQMFEGTTAETLTGRVSGTPAYMSPEQAMGNELRESSDIFSLGLVLVQMLNGRSLMGNLSALEIISALRTSDFVEDLIDKIPSEYRVDLADMFSMSPSDRPKAEDICIRMAKDN